MALAANVERVREPQTLFNNLALSNFSAKPNGRHKLYSAIYMDNYKYLYTRRIYVNKKVDIVNRKTIIVRSRI